MAPVPGFLQSILLKTQQMISQLAMRPGYQFPYTGIYCVKKPCMISQVLQSRCPHYFNISKLCFHTVNGLVQFNHFLCIFK